MADKPDNKDMLLGIITILVVAVLAFKLGVIS